MCTNIAFEKCNHVFVYLSTHTYQFALMVSQRYCVKEIRALTQCALQMLLLCVGLTTVVAAGPNGLLVTLWYSVMVSIQD